MRCLCSTVALVLPGTVIMAAQLPHSSKKRILVLCTGSSARSQMAAAFLKSFDAQQLEVYSAGTFPARRINPHAVAVLKEVGIDISSGTPNSVHQFASQAFDCVITVCDDADKNCPNFTGKVGKRVHIGFRDPAKATGTDEQVMAAFRQVRDDIKRKFFDYYTKEISRGL